ncbi:MAG: ribosome maturation factor RimP [Smithella sp.]
MIFEDLKDKVRQFAEPVVAAEGMELIHVECLRMHSRWIIRLFLDKEGGVTLDDCTTVSNQVGDIFDINDLIDAQYTLEVSSPGPERPISRDQDFIKYRGLQVSIKTGLKIDNSNKFRGVLIDFIEENNQKVIVLQTLQKIYRIPKTEIVKANLVDTGK